MEFHNYPSNLNQQIIFKYKTKDKGNLFHGKNPDSALPFPISSLVWPVKMFPVLMTQKPPENRSNQELQIFVFTLRTPVKLLRPSRVCRSEQQQGLDPLVRPESSLFSLLSMNRITSWEASLQHLSLLRPCQNYNTSRKFKRLRVMFWVGFFFCNSFCFCSLITCNILFWMVLL